MILVSFNCAFSCEHFDTQLACTCFKMELSWVQICLPLVHEWCKGECASETARKISGAWGHNTVTEKTARKWLAKFKTGKNNLGDQSRSGHQRKALLFVRASSLAFFPDAPFAHKDKANLSRRQLHISKYSKCISKCWQENAQLIHIKIIELRCQNS
ncbi:hypothetical protein KIN20_008224 [Parelaphostrongylus tenuis]|uniref:Mos1 transposase HTH domain-containing protein n=1 Tax=Parelaphostrongylus tenuis TaxID=148309 RepID=A0AAD5M4G6_PARTN|nr:hypothetical protein KIN20_008224 [Parelaphostrongylus tenuis]